MYEKSRIIAYKQKLQNWSSLDIIQSQMKQIVFNKFNFQDTDFVTLPRLLLDNKGGEKKNKNQGLIWSCLQISLDFEHVKKERTKIQILILFLCKTKTKIFCINNLTKIFFVFSKRRNPMILFFLMVFGN